MKSLLRLTVLILTLSLLFVFVACDGGNTPSDEPPADDLPGDDTPPVTSLPEYGDNVVDFDSLK